MARHETRFRTYQRMPYVYATWHRMGETKQLAIRRQAEMIFMKMENGTL